MTDVADVVRRADRLWRRVGVARGARAEMADELRADLAAAVADGRDAVSLIGADVDAFALDWARERGEIRPRTHYLRTVVATFAGLVLGMSAAAGATAVAGFAVEMFATSDGTGRTVEDWLVLVVYGGSALAAYAGGLVVAGWSLRRAADPRAGSTVRALAWLLPPAAAVATAVGVSAAAVLHFSRTGAVILLVCHLVADVLVTAVLLARWWALREPARRESPVPAGVPVAA